MMSAWLRAVFNWVPRLHPGWTRLWIPARTLLNLRVVAGARTMSFLQVFKHGIVCIMQCNVCISGSSFVIGKWVSLSQLASERLVCMCFSLGYAPPPFLPQNKALHVCGLPIPKVGYYYYIQGPSFLKDNTTMSWLLWWELVLCQPSGGEIYVMNIIAYTLCWWLEPYCSGVCIQWYSS